LKRRRKKVYGGRREVQKFLTEEEAEMGDTR